MRGEPRHVNVREQGTVFARMPNVGRGRAKKHIMEALVPECKPKRLTPSDRRPEQRSAGVK